MPEICAWPRACSRNESHCKNAKAGCPILRFFLAKGGNSKADLLTR
jgi:hypothetical protein